MKTNLLVVLVLHAVLVLTSLMNVFVNYVNAVDGSMSFVLSLCCQKYVYEINKKR